MKAHDLFMRFVDWGYKTPTPERNGTIRRIKRELAKKEAMDRLYANTPKKPI